jgi:hypothetical protein
VKYWPSMSRKYIDWTITPSKTSFPILRCIFYQIILNTGNFAIFHLHYFPCKDFDV